VSFWLPFGYVFALGLFFTEDSRFTKVLHRDQTDEWKGKDTSCEGSPLKKKKSRIVSDILLLHLFPIKYTGDISQTSKQLFTKCLNTLKWSEYYSDSMYNVLCIVYM
jgi:hypothetical protein